MIHELSANNPGFRKVKFTPGLNVILADRSATAGVKDTTNALGKSTLIDVIDYCFGSSPSPGKGVRAEALQGWSFTLDVTIAGNRVRVTRSVDESSFVAVDGETAGWPIQPNLTNKSALRGFDVKAWRSVLGWALFRIDVREGPSGYAPSPRTLLSYFLRSQPSAYIEPFKHFPNQKTYDIQLHNALLLGLNWEKAADWQVLKDQKSALDALQAAIKTGAIVGDLNTVGELEAERVQLDAQLETDRNALSSFRVHPQFRDIQDEANRLTGELHSRVNANIAERRRLERYEATIANESAPAEDRLDALYKEAGVVLPDAVTRTLSEAREFNRKIVENRRIFVADEIRALKERVDDREKEIARLSDTRSELLETLSGHGALEEHTRLQERHAAARQRLESIRARIAQVREMTTKKDEIKVATVALKKAAELDYEERRPAWSKALTLFAENSQALYKVPGRLVIDIDDTGYRFNVEIPGSPSEGISKMKILCYDLMLISFARTRGLGLDFLIHDSTIFDGVDSRQVAHALELAAELADRNGFQYICTMNSDVVPTADFSPSFKLDNYVRMTLTDTHPSGSLLGFRF